MFGYGLIMALALFPANFLHLIYFYVSLPPQISFPHNSKVAAVALGFSSLPLPTHERKHLCATLIGPA